nr:MAG TPA_asm: hypothetical protein [Caudoviricetes sp.]
MSGNDLPRLDALGNCRKNRKNRKSRFLLIEEAAFFFWRQKNGRKMSGN